MTAKGIVRELIARDLHLFEIIEVTEVFRVDDDGLKQVSLGFFKDPSIAEAFAGAQTDSNWHKTEKVLVLTDGAIGFVVPEQDSVKFFDEESEALALRKQAIAKLSPAERKLLGFAD